MSLCVEEREEEEESHELNWLGIRMRRDACGDTLFSAPAAIIVIPSGLGPMPTGRIASQSMDGEFLAAFR